MDSDKDIMTVPANMGSKSRSGGLDRSATVTNLETRAGGEGDAGSTPRRQRSRSVVSLSGNTRSSPRRNNLASFLSRPSSKPKGRGVRFETVDEGDDPSPGSKSPFVNGVLLHVYVARGAMSHEKQYYGPCIASAGSKHPASHGQTVLDAHDDPCPQFPVYVGPDATVYDIRYRPIPAEDVRAPQLPPEDLEDPEYYYDEYLPYLRTLRGRSHLQIPPDNVLREEAPRWLMQNRYRPTSQAYQSQPNPEDYADFFAYEEALLEWAASCETALGAAELPSVLGRAYHRPRVNPPPRSRIESDMTRSDRADSDVSIASTVQSALSSTSTLLPGAGRLSTSALPQHLSPLREGTAHKRRSSQIEDITVPYERMGRMRAKSWCLPNFDPESLEPTTDTWSAHLYPVEPDPQFYASFENYERALLNWASVCVDLEFLPPHAYQLADLAGLSMKTQPYVMKAFQDKRKQEMENAQRTSGIGLSPTPVSRTRSGGIVRGGTLDDTSTVPAWIPRPSANGWSDLPESAQENIHDLFEKWLDISRAGFVKRKKFGTPPVATVHGVLPNTTLQRVVRAGSKAQAQTFSPAGNGQSTRIENVPLRRTDMSASELDACLDSPTVVDGKTVEFRVPQVDVPSMNIAQLSTNPLYKEGLMQSLMALEHRGRHDPLNSWYYPRLDRALLTSRYDETAELIKFTTPLNSSHLRSILSNNLYLDQFQQLLAEYVDDKNQRTIRDELATAFSPSSYRDILSLLRDTSSVLTHAKVATFVGEVFQLKVGRDIFEAIIDTQDLEHMYHLAYAMTFFHPLPKPLFAYDGDTMCLLKLVGGPELRDITFSILLLYYMQVVLDAIKPKAFLYMDLDSFLREVQDPVREDITYQIKSSSRYLPSLMTWLEHRSPKVCRTVLFTIAQLLKSPDEGTIQIMQDPETALIERLRELGESSVKHAEFAVKTMFSLLRHHRKWTKFTMETYADNPRWLIDDLLLTPLKRGTLDKQPLVTSEVLAFFSETITLEYDITIFTQGDLFRDLLKRVCSVEVTELQATCAATHFLSVITKSLYRLGRVRIPEAASSKSKKGEVSSLKPHETLNVTKADIMMMMEFLSALTKDHAEIKINMLEALRWIMKTEGAFSVIKSNKDFFKKLNVLCRDGTDMAANRTSWRLFFQLIRYHPHAIEDLKSSKQLGPFLEIVGITTGHAVMCNGLHYLAKMFLLATSEQQRLTDGRRTVPEHVRKTFEKGVKTLAKFFFKRHLFIKVHMIYKKVGTTYNGMAFERVAHLYKVLMTTPQCAKPLKDVLKIPEYRAGLERFANL